MLGKPASWVVFLVFVMCIATLAFSIQSAKAQPSTIYVDDSNITGPWNGTSNFPYKNITSGLAHATLGATIFVRSGTYLEHIEINKTITLIGQNQTDTAIDGDGQEYIPIVLITAPDVAVANFTIKNTATTDTYGILISKTQNVTLINNTIKETYRGIVINNSSQCRILNNWIVNNYAYGLSLRSDSNQNLFSNNNIAESRVGAWLDVSCQDNTFYHNSFINNVFQVDSVNYGTRTKWNNTYPIGGNYWSDYTGVDLYHGPSQNLNGSDGIGDTPYIKGGARDYYPLMHPHVPIPPIARFTYSPQSPVKNEQIAFNASASYDLNGTIASYKWDFGDGNTTTVATSTITHFYLNYGNYSITLTVTDNDGLTGTKTAMVTVQKRTSTLSIDVYPATIEIGKSTIISGTLSIQGQPPRNIVNILIKHRIQGEANWTILTITGTNVDGFYQYNWTPTSIRIYEIEASWEGNDTALRATSQKAILSVSKKSSTLTISSNRSKVTIGQNITISGKLTPEMEGASITISHYQTTSGTWRILAIAETDSNGNYFYNWKTMEVGWNVLKAGWPGDEQTLADEDFVTITVDQMSSNITAATNARLAVTGTNITISGRITPSRANVNVTIHIRILNGTGSWNTIVKTDTNGYYTYIWTPYNKGTYKIKASWQGDLITMSTQSEEIEANIQSKVEIPFEQYVTAGIAVAVIFIVLGIIIWKSKKK